jgi:hypothetical protein
MEWLVLAVLTLEVKPIQQVHASVGSSSKAREGKAQIFVRAGFRAHRLHHVYVLLETGIVKADDQAVGFHSRTSGKPKAKGQRDK